jgi:hypothetical protein
MPIARGLDAAFVPFSPDRPRAVRAVGLCRWLALELGDPETETN